MAHERKGRPLTEVETKSLLEQYGIPFPKRAIAKTREEAIKKSREIGFPIVMKILSPDIIHKTDVGGVILDIKNEEEVGKAWDQMMQSVKQKAPSARIEGVLLEEMIKGGYEVIIGGLRDPVFGPVVMFGGLGGIYVELFEDVAFRLAPVDEREAEEMMKETKGYQILAGYRGMERGDIEALKKLIVKVSQIMNKHEEILELDLNPVRVFPNRVVVLDAKCIVAR
ncbi:MAG: acetate--CoA ligase family protein [Candidatus Njordarchaeales archaeon]